MAQPTDESTQLLGKTDAASFGKLKPWPTGSPNSCCGPDFPHYFCRQLNYCAFANTPVEAVGVTKTDVVNAWLMAGSTWFFLLFAVLACAFSGDTSTESSIGAGLRELGEGLGDAVPYQKIWCVAIIANSVLSMFPTFYCVTICNIFRAKIVANQIWVVVLFFICISFLKDPFEGYYFMTFGMGWSISMFTVTARGSWWWDSVPLAYIAAVAFFFLTPLCGISAACAGTMSDFHVFAFSACFFFGFMTWSSIEGYSHVHQMNMAPDERMWSWQGPVAFEVPMKKEVPAAWGEAPAP